MMKKFLAVFFAVCFTFCTPVWAQNVDHLIGEAYVYSANLFYCDAERNMVVLKNVSPQIKGNAQSMQTAKDAEYQEMPISCEGKLLDGGYIPQAELNCYADCRVRVVIVRCASGDLRVVALRFR